MKKEYQYDKKHIYVRDQKIYDFGCVYYMRTNSFLQNNGTSFKLTNGKTKLVETPQNGALLFPGKMVHAAPSFFLPVTRYTLSMDVNYSWRMQ